MYSYTKKLRGKTSKIGTLVGDKNIPINKPCQEILQDQYKDMWIEPKEQFLISDPISFFRQSVEGEPNEIIFNIRFTKEKVEESLLKVSTNATAGPDGVPGILLNKLASELAEPLAYIYTQSMESGVFLWKDQFTIPGLKPNQPKNKASSYRPISLTSLIGKNMERLVLNEIVPFLERNGIISERQHGFRRRRSCLS